MKLFTSTTLIPAKGHAAGVEVDAITNAEIRVGGERTKYCSVDDWLPTICSNFIFRT